MNDNLITPQLIKQYPNMSKTARAWISLIPRYKCVNDYFSGLNEGLSLLKIKERNNIINRLVSEDDEMFFGAVAEIAYILFWNNLGWEFVKDPDIEDKVPDFKVIYCKKTCLHFLCDVTVVRHNHPHQAKVIKTLEDLATPLPIPEHPIEQSHRFLMKLNEKWKKYKDVSLSSNAPLVIAFFLEKFEDRFYLDEWQVTKALFGDETVNFSTNEVVHMPRIARTAHGESRVGVFAFDDGEHGSLAAVIVCEQELTLTSKAKFTFNIYLNPFGELADGRKNPFPADGGSLDGVVGIQFKAIHGQEV